MFKGIQLLLLSLLITGSAYAAGGDQELKSKVAQVRKVCLSLGGEAVKGNVVISDDGSRLCQSFSCKKGEGNIDVDGMEYDVSVGIKAVCIDTPDIIDNNDGSDNNSDNNHPGGDYDGWFEIDGHLYPPYCRGIHTTAKCQRARIRVSSGGIDINTDGGVIIDGGGRYPRDCYRLSGKLKRKCRKGQYDSEYNDDGSGGGNWRTIRRGGLTFRCAYYMSEEDCLGDDANIINANYSSNTECVSCGSNGRGGAYGTLSGVAEVLGAVGGPLAYYFGQKVQANAYLGANQAWAGAAATGFEQCGAMQSNYVNEYYGNQQSQMDYVAQHNLPDRDFDGQPDVPGCNGYGLGSFAGGMGFMGNGMGGFGGPWSGAGYSPGFMGGMSGPYGQYNPYGQMNGMGGGYPGMGGMGGGYPGMGGIGGGIGIGGGYPGMGGIGGGIGMGGGYPGMGGMGGGLYGNNGFGNGFQGPGPGVGLNGGIGFGNGYGNNGYGNNGYGNNGYGNNGYGNNGYGNGGMYGNPNGGAYGNGTSQWNNGAGSYWNGSGGGNWGNVQQSQQLNQQALYQDNQYSQQALQNSYQQAGQNLWSTGYGGQGYGGQYGGQGYGGQYGGQGYGGQYGGQGYGGGGGYGYAPYSPGNVGLSMNLGWGYGF